MTGEPTPACEQDIVLTPDQVARAPEAVRQWLCGLLGDDERLKRGYVLERHGVMSSGDGLAICSAGEIGEMLNILGDDLLGCEILFELGCDYYDPATGEHLARTMTLEDFIHHTDAANTFEVTAALARINEALRRVRHDRDATIYRPDERGLYHIHKTTQRVIYQYWQRVAQPAQRWPASSGAAAA